MHYLDINNWNRKEHFHFFKIFEEPFFGVTVDVDCTNLYLKSKETNTSFFLRYLHASLVSANSIEAFKYRIENIEKVAVHDVIDASATISRADNTFGFSYIHFNSDFIIFAQNAQKEIDRIQSSNSLLPPINQQNCIYFSSLPWLKFTSLSHARNFSIGDSVPKISFGKLTDVNKKKSLPVSIHVHHALCDGYDVGRFVERFQEELDRS